CVGGPGPGRRDYPGASAGGPAGGRTAAGRLADDTSSRGVLPPVHPATSARRRPRCRRTSGHLRPQRRRWLGSTGRRRAAHPPGTPCRTARRSGTWVPSSLWHATSPATSQPCVEVVGSSPISRLSLLRTLALNRGPFPPPAFPGLDGTMGLSASPGGPACPSRASGWLTHPPPGVSRVAFRSPCADMPAPLPRRDRRRDRVAPRKATAAAFPQCPRGRLPQPNHFEACSAFTHVLACLLAE